MAKTISTRLVIEGEKEYKNAIKEVNGELKVLKTELEKVSSEYQNNSDSAEALEAKIEVLRDIYDAQARKVEECAEALENARQQQEEYGAQVDTLRDQLSSTEEALEKMRSSSDDTTEAEKELEQEIDNINEQLTTAEAKYDAASGAVDRWTINLNQAQTDLNNTSAAIENNSAKLEEQGNKSSDAAEGLSTLNNVAGNGVTAFVDLTKVAQGFADGGAGAVIASAGAIVTALGQVFSAFESGKEILVQATGATGNALNELIDSTVNAYAVVDNMDFSKVAATVGEIATRLDLAGAKLTEETILIERFGEAAGIDAAGSVAGITKVMKNWNVEVEDTETLLDKLITAGEASGVSIDSLTSTLTTNKVQLQQMGFSLDEAIALLSMMEKEGINASQVMMGFRTAITKFGNEGISASEGFKQLENSIKNAESTTEAISIATEYFGTRAAQELSYGIRTGRFDLEKYTEIIENSADAMDRTEDAADKFGEKIGTSFKQDLNMLKTLAVEAGKGIKNIFGNGADREYTEFADTITKISAKYADAGDAAKAYAGMSDYLAEVTEEVTRNTEDRAAALEREKDLDDELKIKVEELAKKRGLDGDAIYKQLEGFNDLTNAGLISTGLYEDEIEVIGTLADARSKEREKIDDLTKAIERGEDAQERANYQIERYSGQLAPDMIEAYKNAAEAQEKEAQKQEKLKKEIEKVNTAQTQLQEQYGATKAAAEEAITKQIGLFDELVPKTEKSISDMISALESQISFMDEYASNMQKAVERGVDKGLVKKLSDGTAESAGYLAQLANATDAEIAEINSKLGEVEKGKDKFSSAIAEMTTNYTKEKEKLEKEAAELAKAFNKSEETTKAGEETIQGFINGAESKRKLLEEVVKGLAKKAIQTLFNTISGNSASGLESEIISGASDNFYASSSAEITALAANMPTLPAL